MVSVQILLKIPYQYFGYMILLMHTVLRHSVLKLSLSQKRDEKQVLILRYVAFKIISIELQADPTTIHFTQCSEQMTETIQSTANNGISLELDDY